MEVFANSGPKVLYCGPAQAGKRTNIRYLADHCPGNKQTELQSARLGSSQLLLIKILPLNEVVIKHLFDRPGAAGPVAIYSLCGPIDDCNVLEDLVVSIDSVVFVADARFPRREDNIKSMEVLRDTWRKKQGRFRKMPVILQYNKMEKLSDVSPDARIPYDDLERDLNSDNSPAFEASAKEGLGVFATLIAAITLACRPNLNCSSQDLHN
jgi:hypothetical protein